MESTTDYSKVFQEETLPEILRLVRNWCISGALWIAALPFIDQIQILDGLQIYIAIILTFPILYFLYKLKKIGCPNCDYPIFNMGFPGWSSCKKCGVRFK